MLPFMVLRCDWCGARGCDGLACANEVKDQIQKEIDIALYGMSREQYEWEQQLFNRAAS